MKECPAQLRYCFKSWRAPRLISSFSTGDELSRDAEGYVARCMVSRFVYHRSNLEPNVRALCVCSHRRIDERRMGSYATNRSLGNQNQVHGSSRKVTGLTCGALIGGYVRCLEFEPSMGLLAILRKLLVMPSNTRDCSAYRCVYLGVFSLLEQCWYYL